jgi:hypothetical protein
VSCALLNVTGGTSNYDELMIEFAQFVPNVICQNSSTFEEYLAPAESVVTSTTKAVVSSCTIS